MTLDSTGNPPISPGDKAAAARENKSLATEDKWERKGCLLAFDWIIRPWHYFDTKPRAVAYVCAGSGFYGGILFVIGSFAGCSPAVANSYVGGDGLKTQYDWRDGSLDSQWQARQETQVQHPWLSSQQLCLVGGLTYMIGAVQYNVASTTGLAANFPRVFAAWPPKTYKWASTVMYTWGGGFFLIAGACYVLLDMGLPGLLLGTLLPFRREDRTRLTWWTNWFNFWGGVLFCVGGCFLNYYPNVIPFHPTYQIENAINYGYGSFCFLMSGLLMYIQMSIRDEDTLPLSLPPQQRDSISRPSIIGRPSNTSMRPTPSQQIHRDDSARVSKAGSSIVS